MENSKKDPKKNTSEIKVRMQIQQIMHDNMRTPIGMFHSKELNERNFINDLFKNFNITPKDNEK